MLAASGCGAFLDPIFEIGVDEEQPDWALTAADMASDVWSDHSVLFLGGQGSDSKLRVEVVPLPPDRIAECYCNVDFTSGIIHVIPRLETSEYYNDQVRSCVIAHEMGHALGMNHSDDINSLMSPVIINDMDGPCSWSDLDQAELCRVQPYTCDR